MTSYCFVYGKPNEHLLDNLDIKLKFPLLVRSMTAERFTSKLVEGKKFYILTSKVQNIY